MAKDEAKWAYWTKCIKAWQASGLLRHAYCQRGGLKPTTFDYWRPLIASDHAEVNAVTQPVSGEPKLFELMLEQLVDLDLADLVAARMKMKDKAIEVDIDAI